MFFNKDLERRIHNLEVTIKELQPLLENNQKEQKKLKTEVLKYICENFKNIKENMTFCSEGFYDEKIKIYNFPDGWRGSYCDKKLSNDMTKEFFYLLRELKK